mgnify:CR=1 FL=1
MLNFQKEAIPEAEKLFQTFDPENEENTELFKNIDISERFAGGILASSRYHKLVDESLGKGATFPGMDPKVRKLILESAKHYTNATQEKVLKISQYASLQWTRTRHLSREASNP